MRGYKQTPDEDQRFGKQDFITYEMINEPRRSYLSDAAMTERSGNFEEAILLFKLAQIEASTNAFLRERTKPEF